MGLWRYIIVKILSYFDDYRVMSDHYSSRGNREKRSGSDGRSHSSHSLEPSYKRQLTDRTPVGGGGRVSQNNSSSTPLSHRPERSGIGVDADEWEVYIL